MVDWGTVILTGLFMGIGTETAKILHELYLAPKIRDFHDSVEKGKEILGGGMNGR